MRRNRELSMKFYNGHSMEWIDKFKKATPSNLHLTTALCLAFAIHHLTTIKKQNTIKLTRKDLNDFGLNFRRVKPYLLSFEKAGLIELSIRNRSMTQIKLLLLDPYQYVPNFKQRIQKSTYRSTKGTESKREQSCTRMGIETDPVQEQLHSSHSVVGRKGKEEDAKVGRTVRRIGRKSGKNRAVRN
jgi:hypothetical protein